LASSKGGHARFGANGYICRNIRKTMAEHHHEGHFPEEAEQNEIGGPVVFALMCFAAVILLIWAGC
jgi:hypothetical protein